VYQYSHYSWNQRRSYKWVSVLSSTKKLLLPKTISKRIFRCLHEVNIRRKASHLFLQFLLFQIFMFNVNASLCYLYHMHKMYGVTNINDVCLLLPGKRCVHGCVERKTTSISHHLITMTSWLDKCVIDFFSIRIIVVFDKTRLVGQWWHVTLFLNVCILFLFSIIDELIEKSLQYTFSLQADIDIH